MKYGKCFKINLIALIRKLNREYSVCYFHLSKYGHVKVNKHRENEAKQKET